MSHPVYVHAVGFFGPKDVDESIYEVSVYMKTRLSSGGPYSDRRLVGQKTIFVSQEQETFEIPVAIHLVAHLWYSFEFTLKVTTNNNI